MTTNSAPITLDTLLALHGDAAAPAPTPSPIFRKGPPPGAVAAIRRPTAPQRTYLTSLLAQRAGNPDAEAIRADINTALAAGTLDFHTVSKAIGTLKAIPANPATPAAAATPTVRGGAWSAIPDGYYAVPSATGTNDLDFYSVTTEDEEGDWFGFRRVERVIGGNADAKVNGPARRAALVAIETATYGAPEVTIVLEDGSTGTVPAREATGPEAAALRYADEIGRCRRCNRTLTDLTSRINGIGPVCKTR